MGYEIFAMELGQGALALSAVPAHSGDLAADVDAVVAWGATLVVSATERDEMAALGAEDLPTLLRDTGIAWAHFPIRDFGVPEGDVAHHWARLSTLARSHLQKGARVLVHCRGGCGRSGMLVLRLMVESGEAAEEALQRLRAVRPCAVETDAQMAWATGGVIVHA